MSLIKNMMGSKTTLLTLTLFTIIIFTSFNINYQWGSTPVSKPKVDTNIKNKYLVVIGSNVEFGSRRELIRSSYFDIQDNLVPILPSQQINYVFCIHGDLPKSDTPEKRSFETEKMEYNDIYIMNQEFSKDNVLDWVRNRLLKEKQDYSFDYLVIQDIHSFMKLDNIIETMETSDNKDIIWGNNEKGLVIGSTAFDSYNDNKLPSTTDLLAQEWKNSIESVNNDNLIIYNIYQDKDFYLTSQYHLASKRKESMIKLEKSSSKRVIVTSSYIYDKCMEPSGTKASLNKRDYADKHDYAFVARSSEFAQQSLRPDKRRTVWGKIDVIQKVLPKFEWLFWLDMDAVIMNDEITIDSLLNNIDNLQDIHFIIVRPGTDKMINAGVFLIKNTPWSFQFLQDIQDRQEWYRQGPSYEQGAMWDVMRQDKYLNHTLFLDRENHYFNTFPKYYENNDFIVHFAPDKCPNSATLKGLAAVDKIKHGERITPLDLL